MIDTSPSVSDFLTRIAPICGFYNGYFIIGIVPIVIDIRIIQFFGICDKG